MNEKIYKALMVRMANKSRAFWSLASAVNVYISDKDNYNGEPAITFGNNVILYNDFAKMDWIARETYFVHLVLHWVKRHSKRNNNLEGMYLYRTKADRETMKKVLNFVEDCQIGWLMKSSYPKHDNRYDLFKKINFDVDWDAESLEQIIHRIFKSDEGGASPIGIATKNSNINVVSTNDAMNEGLESGLDEMEKIQDGQIEKRIKKAKEAGVDIDEEMEKIIQDHVRTMLLASKQAGHGQDDLFAKLLGELEPPQVPWQRVVINSLRGHVKAFSDATWSRASRRGDDHMGTMHITRPKVWVTADTSGSISNQDFIRFISELQAILPHVSEAEFILWDDGIVKYKGEPYRKKYRPGNRVDLVRSSGGTNYAPVVQDLIKEIKNGDIIINMTDGYWSDCPEEMAMLAKKHTKRVLVTTAVEREGWSMVFKVDSAKDADVKIEEVQDED